MYRIDEKFSFLKKNYLYIYFKNDLVTSYSLKRFKVNEHSKSDFDISNYLKQQLDSFTE
jgi:hypothetical protein